SLLSTVATHDQSSDVRATACAYFLRTAPTKSDPHTLAFAQARLLSDTAVVREAILLEHEGNRFLLPEPLLLSLLQDAEPLVRSLAVRCVRGGTELSE